MILAEKFTCDVPAEGITFLECTMPDSGLLEWITAIGTLGSALAAVGLAIWSISKDRRAQKREEFLTRQATIVAESEPILEYLAQLPDLSVSEAQNNYMQILRSVNRFSARIAAYGAFERKFSSSLSALMQKLVLNLHNITLSGISREGWNPSISLDFYLGFILAEIEMTVRNGLLALANAETRLDVEMQVHAFIEESERLQERIPDELGVL